MFGSLDEAFLRCLAAGRLLALDLTANLRDCSWDGFGKCLGFRESLYPQYLGIIGMVPNNGETSGEENEVREVQGSSDVWLAVNEGMQHKPL